MFPRLILLLAIAVSAIGCGQRASRSPAGAEAARALDVQQSKAGGGLLLIPAGEFTMGNGAGRNDEQPPHTVSVSAFFLDKVPVTQQLYEKVMGVNPSKRKGPTLPVERTQWTDAVRFCNKCSEMDGLTPCYDLATWECNFAADGYRLPTEAEWEFACRAGSAAKYAFGDAEADLPQYAWFQRNSAGMTHPVGQKRPNYWGLQDMHGNVWQWCHDFYGESYYAESPRENPRGPATGKMRVLRGGAWDCPAEKCRAAYRFKEYPVYSDACFGSDSYGFRRARIASPAPKPNAVAVQPPAAPQPDAPKKAEPVAGSGQPAPAAGKIDLANLKGTIVFVSDRSSTLKIWRMRANGKDAKQLTHDANTDADPRFSPDGKRIMYTSLRGGFPEVWMMKWDGSDPHFVAKGSQASWSPDGRSIVLIRDNQAYVRELASGREQRLTPPSWERCGVPAWSPDGKQVAVASRHLENIGIFLLGPDGKEIQQLKAQEPCCTPHWSKDGRKMLCQTVQGHIHQLELDGNNWEQMTFGADVQHDACYSPDGALILFCRAPTPAGPWQLCVKRLDGDDPDFVALTKEGSNLLPDWHADE